MTSTPIIGTTNSNYSYPGATNSGYGSANPTSSGSSGAASSSSSTSTTNPSLNLSPTSFVQFLITEMQNQDPLNPTSSDTMLQQMSEIGQLQSSTDLDTDLKGLTLQNQVGSASSLLGKEVTGTDGNNNPLTGVVTGVQVNTNSVSLQLDNGSSMSLGSVSTITTATGATTSTGATSQTGG